MLSLLQTLPRTSQSSTDPHQSGIHHAMGTDPMPASASVSLFHHTASGLYPLPSAQPSGPLQPARSHPFADWALPERHPGPHLHHSGVRLSFTGTRVGSHRMKAPHLQWPLAFLPVMQQQLSSKPDNFRFQYGAAACVLSWAYLVWENLIWKVLHGRIALPHATLRLFCFWEGSHSTPSLLLKWCRTPVPKPADAGSCLAALQESISDCSRDTPGVPSQPS